MPYVERGIDGNINGRYRWPQPGRAEEFVADTDAEIAALEAAEAPAYRQLRAAAYAAELGQEPGFAQAIGDQLDAIWKQFADFKRQGMTLLPKTEKALDTIARIKTDNPEP